MISIMKVYALNIEDESSDVMFDVLLSYASNEKHEKIKRFTKKLDAKRTLLSDLLTRVIIMENLKIQNKDINFNYNKYGKPFLQGYDNLHFNASHSGSWVVCALDNNFLGIDIEKIDCIDLEIAKNFFSAKEYIELMSKAQNQRQPYFFDLWTLKESYIKALGFGLSLPLDSFTIRIINHNILLETENLPKQYFFKQYNIDNDYKLSLCSLNDTFPNSVCIKSIKDIITTIVTT